ncbi:MAG: ABC transporter permease [Lewinellaceae bacterium]|nr:ABC transporter permease [Lewinella sp.]MCB9279066.1 ABC transporter permease [Lewinellaceae bacterium]
MLKNYFMIAWRNLWKEKRYSMINITGLSVGIAVFVLLSLYVTDEWSFDRFHTKSDRIYRAWVKEHFKGDVFFNTVTPIPLGVELKNNFPEVEQAARYITAGTMVKKEAFSEMETVHMADPAFFKIFDFPLVRGRVENLFNDLRTVVLTEEMGQKYFGDPYPMGQTISLQMDGEWQEFTVKGIIADAPDNSSIQYDFIIPFDNTKTLFREGAFTCWTCVFGETYILLNEQNDLASFNAKIAGFMDKKVAEIYKPGEYEVGLQPLADIHLDNDFPPGVVPVSDGKYPYILGGIALLILLLAGINFTTLAIGRSVSRSKEVGVRKVAGATRPQLMGQFWSEAVLTSAVAVIFGVLLAMAVMPYFNQLADKQLHIRFTPLTIAGLAGLAAVTGLLSGIYPSLVLSSFSPLQSIRGTLGGKIRDKQVVLKGLVGFQFVLSIILIVSTLAMNQQIRYIQNKNLGYNRDQVLIVPYNNSGLRLSELYAEGINKSELLRSELTGADGVTGIAVSTHTFGTQGWANVGYTEKSSDKFRSFNILGADEHFIPMMGLELLDGRNFSKDQGTDKRGVIINEAYAKAFGFDQPVGKQLQEPYQDYKIIGLARDFNFASLHQAIDPLVIALDPIGIFQASSDHSFGDSPNPKISFKIEAGKVQEAIHALEGVWPKIAGDQPFSFTFMDENIDNQYRAEMRLGQLVSLATLLAIFIACLGLFGIAALSISRRVKEIGVRKVLGASVPDIVLMLNRRFAVLVGIAALIATPAAWYFMDGWLADFAFRIRLSPWLFIAGALGAVAVAVLTVSLQSVRAARSNPVDAIRTE